MITVVARIIARKGCEDKLRAELHKLVAPTRIEKGCINYDLHESESEPGNFLFYENWVTKKDVEIHLVSNHVASVFKNAEAFLAKPVELTYWNMLSKAAK